ncbi:MAG: FliM/FliN family flagellar motor C-terminal domain-containing protein [Rhodocyclaceae bacterium]
MDARPLLNLSSAQATLLRDHFASIAKAWSRDWLDAGDPLNVMDCRVATESSFALWSGGYANWRWMSLGLDGSRLAWVAAPLDVEAQVAAACGLDTSHPLATHSSIGDTLVVQAWSDLLIRLGGGAFVQPSASSAVSPMSTLSAPFSGAAMLYLDLSGVPLVLALNGSAVLNLAPRRDSIEQVPTVAMIAPSEALKRLGVLIECSFAPTEVALGTLNSLTVGDVLVLEHGLHEPLHVNTREGSPVCRAYLGRHAEAFAVALALETL